MAEADLGKVVRAIFSVPGKQSDVIAFFVREDPVAVVFLLVDPSKLVERFGNESRKHGLDAEWDPVGQPFHVLAFHSTSLVQVNQHNSILLVKS